MVTATSGFPSTSQPTISGGGWANGDQVYWIGTTPPVTGIRNELVAVYFRVQATAIASNPTHFYGSTNTQAVAAIASFKPS